MNYGRVAKSYQFLSRMVFGRALLDAQKKALANLKNPCELMIIGGGDGEILKYLSHFSGVLDYVEVSSEMVREAKSKTELAINWHIYDIFEFKTDRKYDTIFLPFVLDNFTTNQCSNLILQLKQMLKMNGQIIVVDFTETPSFWQKRLLNLMYAFFHFFAQIKVNEIPKIEQSITSHRLHKTLEMISFRGFIEVKQYSRKLN